MKIVGRATNFLVNGRSVTRIVAAVVAVVAALAIMLIAIGGMGVTIMGAASVGGAQVANVAAGDGGSGGTQCGTTVSTSTGASTSGTSTSEAVTRNVRTIIGVGKGLGISDVGIKVALVAAIKETGILNLPNDGVHGSEDDSGEWPASGQAAMLALSAKSMNAPNDGAAYYAGAGTDHDSVGIYQQRVSYWWPGSYDDTDTLIKTMMDPQYQATAFFVGIHGDGGLKGKTDVWNATGTLSGSAVNQAVQAVQGAAAGTVSKAQTFWDQAVSYYNANADAPTIAETAQIKALIGSPASSGGASTVAGSSTNCAAAGGSLYTGDATGVAKKILENAYAQDGYPYQWGGGDPNGPNTGQNKWPGVVGFDCSGLVLYSIYKATDGKVSLPHQSGAQEAVFRSNGWMIQDSSGTQPPSDAKPGDIAFFGAQHVAIYAGVIDGKPQYFQATWNYKASLGSDETDIGLGDVGRQYTSWGRVGGK